jgi:glycosyltransferase involved in cell wall biosynthesis
MTFMPDVGVVIIGRNEGDRLVACLDSLAGSGTALVYVDSGSTDTSVDTATSRGITVVELPLDQPFTAGRARNAGFHRLLELHPGISFVQFVDGDCRVAEGWLAFAAGFLESHPTTAIVCGRRKEIQPELSLYNRLCDIEWNTPLGETDACGGDFMVRAAVFASVNGFDPGLIAGEEPEMCFRIRRLCWTIYRAAPLMTLHDAAMTRFSQWVRRSSRSGYAYAARGALHWHSGYCRRENLRIAFWAGVLPVLSLLGTTLISPWLLLLVLLYPLQYARLVQHTRKIDPNADAALYALFLVLGKWPEFYGQIVYLLRRLRGQRPTLIEYK